MKNKSVLITTYDRVTELNNSILALKNCVNFSEYNLVIIYHIERPTTKSYIETIKDSNIICLPVDGTGKSGLENMNYNRIFGLDYCFNFLNSEFVIAIEDDILLGYDALFFSEKILNKFKDNLLFRGVNLGSKEKITSTNKFAYGRFRYGLFGQGSLITNREWKILRKLNIFKYIKYTGFDALVEHYYKTGFVIMPYASRYVDKGWNGTHAPKDPNDIYYKSLNESWVGTLEFQISDYKEEYLVYNWREDCITYKSKNNLKFFFFFLKFYLSIILKKRKF